MGAADIFAGVVAESAYRTYAAELQVLDKIVGGIPKDPDTIAKWLRARLEMEDRAVIELAEETAALMMAEREDRPGSDELIAEVARRFEGGNGFKTFDGQLCYEGRNAKAMLKEACNVAYPGTDFPGKEKTFGKSYRKGLMRTLAERVFVPETYIPLGVSVPSATEQRVKHVMTPQGPRSAINVVDVVDRPRVCFSVQVLDDFLPPAAWGRIWEIGEAIGIGSDRARGDGKFSLERWEPLD